MRNRKPFCRFGVLAIIFAASAIAAEAYAGWPLGQPAGEHVPLSYRGYWVAPTYSYMLHREIPVSRVQVVPSAAHWMTLEHPDVLAAAILQFLT
jgi:pimeloyl-ACP methyl ester carboxylesterase